MTATPATAAAGAASRRRFSAPALLCALAVVACCAPGTACGQAGTFMSTAEFLSEGLGGAAAAGTYSLSAADQAAARSILGHSYKSSRLRYWRAGDKTAWVLEEIGKTRPITTGFVIDGGKVDLVRVLVYRESHGGEVKNRFFTRQFRGAHLSGSRQSLSKRIRNISGATLSVNALRNLSRFALYLDSKVRK